MLAIDVNRAFEFLQIRLEDRLRDLEKEDLITLALWGAGAQCACIKCSPGTEHLEAISCHCEAVSLCRSAIAIMEDDREVPVEMIIQLSEASHGSGLPVEDMQFYATPDGDIQ